MNKLAGPGKMWIQASGEKQKRKCPDVIQDWFFRMDINLVNYSLD